MPHLDSKYAWEEDLFNLIKWEDWSEDTKYICMDNLEDFKKAVKNSSNETLN